MARRDKRAKPPRVAQVPLGSHMGDFGQEREPVDLTFGWFGRTMRVHPKASVLREVDFVDKALKFEAGDPRNLTWILHQMRMVVHEDDFDEFWALALDKGQREDDLITLHQTIIAGIAQRPTGRSGDSSPGPQTTDQKSESEPESDPVMARYAGRPDLQLAVWRADQDEAAAAAG
jgi:hypothetical protein